MLIWKNAIFVAVASAALFFLDNAGFFNYPVWLARSFVVAPIARSFVFIGNEAFFVFKNVFAVRSIINENEFLKNEMEFFRGEYFKLSNVSEENVFLRRALNLRKESDREKMVLADILSFDPFESNDNFTINKGKRDGVKENDPVILSGNIVVGRIKKVEEKNSVVLLISSPQSKVTSVSEDGKAKGVISGSASGSLVLDFVLKDADLREGQIFTTSGLDGIFKRGFLIGEISETVAQTTASFQKASIKPFFNLRDLNQVFVIVSEL